MEAALPTRTARPASTPAEFSRARSRPTCRWSKRRELSCSSISKGARLTIPLPLPQVEFRSRMPWWDCRCRGILAPSAIIARWGSCAERGVDLGVTAAGPPSHRSRAWSVGLLNRGWDPDFTIIALGSGMQRENSVTADVRRDGLVRRGLGLHQLVVIVEHSFHDLVDEVVGQILVRDREIVEPDRRVVTLLSRIGLGWNQRLRNLRQFLSDYGDLVGRRPYEIHRMRCNQRREHWNREAGGKDNAVQIARRQLGSHALHSAEPDGGLDAESV